MLAKVGVSGKAISVARKVKSDKDLWAPQDVMETPWEGCQRYSAAELWMRMEDWIWDNSKRPGLHVAYLIFLAALNCELVGGSGYY